MTTADRDVTIDILARDKTDKATKSAARNFEQVKTEVAKTTDAEKKNDKASSNLAGTMLTVAKAAGKVGAKVAAVTSLIGPATTGLLAAAKGAVAFGKGLAALGPAAAVLPGLLASFGLLYAAGKLIGPAFAQALSPIKAAFYDVDGNATKLTKHIQSLATAGVRDLTKQLVKLDMPAVSNALLRIAKSVNSVALGWGDWLRSTAGVAFVRDISDATARATEKLSYHVYNAGVALANLAARAGDPAIGGLTDLIGRLLDKFAAWADNTTTGRIADALDELAATKDKVKALWGVLKDIGSWLTTHVEAIKQFSDAAAATAIVLGAATGDVPAVIGGAVSLVANHLAEVKKALSGLVSWLSDTWQKIATDPNFMAFSKAITDFFGGIWESIKPDVDQFTNNIVPRLHAVWQSIHDDWLPAATDWINAIRPVVEWFASVLVPNILNSLEAVVSYLSGFIKVISGIMEVASGLLSGDWSKVWQGLKEIFGGFVEGAKAVWGSLWASLQKDFRAATDAILEIAAELGKRFLAVFAGAEHWLSDTGRKIVSGLADGIRNAWGLVADAISDLLGKAKDKIPSSIRSAIGFSADFGSWAPAQAAAAAAFGGPPSGGFALAGAPSGGGGGFAPRVDVANTVNVALDGRPFYEMTVSALTASERRTAWRSRVGKRGGGQ